MNETELANATKLDKLEQAVGNLVELKERENAEKTRQIKKEQRNADRLDDLREKVEKVARQSGFQLRDPEPEVTTKEAFFVPPSHRE